MHIHPIRLTEYPVPVSLILGTGDIASAVAHALFRAGHGVVMLRDAATPVLRRGMSFDDALEDGVVELDGVWGVRAEAPEMLPALSRGREAVVLASVELAVVGAICPAMAAVLIDARMRKYASPPDLRRLAPCTIGIGPGFVPDRNVDLGIETIPGSEGEIVVHGATASPTGRSVPLGGAADERFLCAPRAGAWLPKAVPGQVIAQGAVIGWLGTEQLLAPISGRLRGLVRPMPGGVARGTKLAELDPRPDAPFTGMPPRAARIAAGVQRAVDALLPVANMLAAD